MFRVPSDAAVPTFDETFKVGFFRWLTSNAADRREWTTRRNVAAQLAQRHQADRLDANVAAQRERYIARRAELEARAAEIRAEIAAKLRGRRR